MAKTIEFQQLANPQTLACEIARYYQTWKTARAPWEAEKQEIRNYVFARDTKTTSNNTLPWKNSTTLPKLCQIRDNLHANYMAALFPREEWFEWQAGDKQAATKKKAKAIKTYMLNKLRASKFREEVSKLVYDYIDYGNVFAETVHERTYHTPPGEAPVAVYIGPKCRRLSPYDLVFDLTAPSFDEAPKITRRMFTLGDLKKHADNGEPWAQAAFESAQGIRKAYALHGFPDIKKYQSFPLEGLGNVTQYFRGAMVEVLEFEGDVYDAETTELLVNHRVIVVDRREVVLKEPYQSWLGQSNKKHAGWRLRPDTPLAMGPLDNLVGMQYRVDHLENLKADVFDQIATPVVYQKGHVEDWEWGPGERIYGDTESSVEVLRPDSTALNAEFQIANMLALMEEMAGAPKDAMGIRTPGEKTAYEVNVLANAAGRIFLSKVQHLESTFIEPVLNDMLEAGRRNLDVTDQIRVQDDDLGVVEFMSVTKEDLKANGKLVPIGARHFADVAQKVQNLNAFAASALYADPEIKAHYSGLELARQSAELLKFDEGTVRKGVRFIERGELARLAQSTAGVVADDAAAGAALNTPAVDEETE